MPDDAGGAPIKLRRPENRALREVIGRVEAQTRDELQKARAAFAHKGNRGDHGEAALRSVLRRYFPSRYAVGHGEIIDSYGGRSRQIDVVVANEDHPFTFDVDKPGLFLIEGVAAVGEVKAVLTGAELTKALDASVRFKNLKQMHIASLANVSPGDRNAFGVNPPAFVFAFESTLTLETIEKKLAQYKSKLPAGARMLEGVFCLDRGYVIDVGDGQGELKAMDGEGRPIAGWFRTQTTDVLFYFLGWLSIGVPRVVRTGSIMARYFVASRES